MSSTDQPKDEGSQVRLAPLPAQWATPSRYMVAAFLIIGGALLLSLLIPIFQIVAWAFFFAFLFYWPIQRIASRRPNSFGRITVILYILVAVLLGFVIYAGLERVIQGISDLTHNLDKVDSGLTVFPGDLASRMLKDTADVSKKVATALASLVGGLLGGIGVIVTAFILSLFLLLNLNQARSFLAEWIPARYQEEITQLLLNLDQIWVGYIFANVIYGGAVGIGSFVEYYLLGVPYPLVMALITGVITPIPSIGGLLASLIVAVPCLLFGSTRLVGMPVGTFALLVYLLNVVVTQLSYYFVALPAIGKLTRLPTALVFIGVTAGMVTGNILLAFLSVPILSTIMVSGKYLIAKSLNLDHVPGQRFVELTEPGFFSQLLLAKRGEGTSHSLTNVSEEQYPHEVQEE